MRQSDMIKEAISQNLGMTVTELRPLTGGDIATAYQVKTGDGRRLFVKTHEDPGAMFPKEANGLRELEKASAIRIPQVLYVEGGLLILEWIETTKSRSDNFFSQFGHALAKLHRTSADKFGFYEDNYIGKAPQRNTPQIAYDKGAGDSQTWAHFFFEYRLLEQYKMLENQGYAADIKHLFKNLEPLVFEIIGECSAEAPALLHGDLWGGNFLVDTEEKACLIDPAVYYGDRETDLAMSTLFGGFAPEFYRAYRSEYPLRGEYNEREPIYQLYHVMNHVNLFGGAYYGQMRNLMRRCLDPRRRRAY